jgi:hypothetical protein
MKTDAAISKFLDRLNSWGMLDNLNSREIMTIENDIKNIVELAKTESI